MTHDPGFTEDMPQKAIDALRSVMDPELGVNVFDLGLIYQTEINAEEKMVVVQMTLSTPSCPLGGIITANIKLSLGEAYPGYEISTELVWDPAWVPGMMSPEARRQLGI